MKKIDTLFKKEYIIGLDIGYSSIKLAVFTRSDNGLRLTRMDLKEIYDNSNETSRENESVSILKSLFKNINPKRSKVVASINCPNTAIKNIVAPYMPKSELYEGLRLQAKNYFPFPINESVLDFEIMGDHIEKGTRKYDISVAVCPVNTINKYLILLAKAGVVPSSFVSPCYALQKIASESNSKAEEAVCYVDIGDMNTELIITKGKHLVFTRKIPISGKDFTKSMTDVLISDRGKVQLSTAEAKKIKHDVGIPLETDSRIIDNKISCGQILSMLRSPVEQLISEIERCFDYYREESSGGKISSLKLFGGGSSLSGLAKYISDHFGIEAVLGDATKGIPMDREAESKRGELSHRMDIAIGAALGEGEGINLLPSEIKNKTKDTITRGTIAAAATASLIAVILLYIGMNIQLDNFKKRANVARLELSSLQTHLQKAEAQALASRVLADEPQWEDVFIELSNLIPDNMHIREMRAENKTITLYGFVDSDEGEQVLADFILTLEKGIFHNVKLVQSKDTGDKDGVEFVLKCWIDYENS